MPQKARDYHAEYLRRKAQVGPRFTLAQATGHAPLGMETASERTARLQRTGRQAAATDARKVLNFLSRKAAQVERGGDDPSILRSDIARTRRFVTDRLRRGRAAYEPDKARLLRSLQTLSDNLRSVPTRDTATIVNAVTRYQDARYQSIDYYYYEEASRLEGEEGEEYPGEGEE